MRHLVLGSLLAYSLFAAAPAGAQVSINKGDCACGMADANLKALKQDRANAIKLRDAFRKMSRRLKATYGSHPNAQAAAASRQEEQEFAQSESAKITPPDGYVGPSSSRYVSLGSTTGQSVPQGHECDPDSSSIDNLQRTLDGSVCAGMAQAIKVHEEYHWARCRRLTDRIYWNRTGAEIAAEEADAYDAQIKVLDQEISNVEKAQRPPKINPLTAYFNPGAVMNASGGCVRAGNDLDRATVR